jgi:hypothetical protein
MKSKEELLINAVSHNFIKQIRYFIDRKMNVNLYNSKESKTLLQIAASEGIDSFYHLYLYSFPSFQIQSKSIYPKL